jgi:hypothetical protein
MPHRVYRFSNSLAFAKISVSEKGEVSLAYIFHDDRIPAREIPCASVEEALQKMFYDSEQMESFVCDIYYQDDYED